MISAVVFASLIASCASLNAHMSMTTDDSIQKLDRNAINGTGHDPAEMQSVDKDLEDDPYTPSVLDGDSSAAGGQQVQGVSSSASVQAVPVPDAQLHHDLDDKGDAGTLRTQLVAAASTRIAVARTQQWSGSQADKGTSEKSGFFGPFMFFGLLLLTVAAAAFFMAKSASGKEQPQSISMCSSVSLGVKPRAAPAPLPAGITEVDVLETFDSYDKARAGFIARDVLEGLIGPDDVAQKNALKSVGQVDKLFYHDFRRLVLQAGPVQNAVANTASRNAASRNRSSPIELGSMGGSGVTA